MNNRIIRSPDTGQPTKNENTLFLAGGITNCPDWQQSFIDLLEVKTRQLLIFNPRQEKYLFGNDEAAIAQIHWEHQHLQESDAIAFWFAATQIQPISLFELGKYFDNTSRLKKVFVGVSPYYPRRLDIITQLELADGPKIEIVDNLTALAAHIALWNGIVLQ